MERNEGGHLQKIEKFDIKLKRKPKNGIILQLHNTVRSSRGDTKRIRFSIATFDDAQNKIACADNVGNVFILDFSALKFWKLKELGPCTAMSFFLNKIDTLIVATTNFDIKIYDIETGQPCLTLKGHSALVKQISFSHNKANNLLTASSVEAIMWELQSFTKYFTLNTYPDARIQQITFTPGGEYLVACFKNDTLQIWQHERMKSVKQIIPNDLKHLKCVAFTKNGRAMAMAGLTPLLILFNMDVWKVLKTIDLSKYNIHSVQSIAFIPQVFDGGANKILGILGSDCTLKIFNLETLTVLHSIKPDSSGVRKFIVSPTGKYFICILQLGEINIYNSSFLLDKEKNEQEKPLEEQPSGSLQKHHWLLENTTDEFTKSEMQHKMQVCLDSARLRRILMIYGEYPDKFRTVIWQSLLNTPGNYAAYAALVNKGIHPAFKDIDKQFTIHSSITLKNLKRLLSCLAHWCPLFGVLKFMPAFVFPFVKVLQKDPLLMFEVVATVLLNYCQLWFEYAPFPPISVLAIVENILSEYDKQLLEFYCSHCVTSQMYALIVLETAFSEVLSSTEWLNLWDHILSNEPAFILMAVVSYNIVQRNAIRNLKTAEEMVRFFHMQNPINKKTFLKKAYVLLNEAPEEIHPRRFLGNFKPLEKGDCYQQFVGYPKATICLKLAAKQRKESEIFGKYNLNELTRKSQEKIIRQEKLKSEQTRKMSTFSDQEDSGDVYGENVNIKQFKKLPHQRHKSFYKKSVKDELIESVMFPAFASNSHKISNHSAQNYNKQESVRNSVVFPQNTQKKSSTNTHKNSNSEELEKLINDLIISSDSDSS